MDVTVSTRGTSLHLVLHGEIDDAAPVIVKAALAVARAENLALILDTADLQPRSSPLIQVIEELAASHRRQFTPADTR